MQHFSTAQMYTITSVVVKKKKKLMKQLSMPLKVTDNMNHYSTTLKLFTNLFAQVNKMISTN